MTPLRQLMIEEMQIRNLAPHTQASYVQQISLLGHRSLSTTARYLRLATNKVCATASPLDALQAVSRVIADPVPAPV